jgi:hypothetical protein
MVLCHCIVVQHGSEPATVRCRSGALPNAVTWGALEDVFDLEDKVTASVVGAIAPKLEEAEIERAKRKPTESLHAYDYYLRGKALFDESDKYDSREAADEGLRLFYKAIELDPNFASAYGVAGTYFIIRRRGAG